MVLGKGKVEAGAWAVIDRSPEPTAMGLKNGAANGKLCLAKIASHPVSRT